MINILQELTLLNRQNNVPDGMTLESSTAAESTDTDSNYDSSDDDSDTPNDLVPITPFELPDDYIYTY